MTKRLEGKSAIVTGAGSGIGAAIAAALAAEGAKVAVADLNTNSAESVAAKIRADGSEAISITVDVSSRPGTVAMIGAVVKAFGKLDIMFNNAGVIQIGPFLDLADETWERTMRVNGTGVLIGTQEAAKQMIAQGGGGKIINTASVASYDVNPNSVDYCASKFVVSAITKGAAKALGEHKITVNNFAPGIVDTPLWNMIDDGSIKHGITQKPREAIERFSAPIILGRYATPKDIVGVTNFLASSDSDYITGQTIVIDGGIVLI